MKAVLFFALLFVVAVLVSSNYCGLRNGARVDPTPCVHNCPGGYQKTCEHGGICTCAKTCVERLDCFNVTCNEVHHPITGLTMYREDAHCLDSACMCAPSSLFQGGPSGGSSNPSGRR